MPHNRLHGMDGQPTLAGILESVLVDAWRVEDGDAELAVGVDCRREGMEKVSAILMRSTSSAAASLACLLTIGMPHRGVELELWWKEGVLLASKRAEGGVEGGVSS